MYVQHNSVVLWHVWFCYWGWIICIYYYILNISHFFQVEMMSLLLRYMWQSESDPFFVTFSILVFKCFYWIEYTCQEHTNQKHTTWFLQTEMNWAVSTDIRNRPLPISKKFSTKSLSPNKGYHYSYGLLYEWVLPLSRHFY